MLTGCHGDVKQVKTTFSQYCSSMLQSITPGFITECLALKCETKARFLVR